jgi:hypothetical protein
MPYYSRLLPNAGRHIERGREYKRNSTEVIESDRNLAELMPEKFIKVNPDELKASTARRDRALEHRKKLKPAPKVVKPSEPDEEDIDLEEEVEIQSNKVDVTEKFPLAGKYGFQVMKDKGTQEFFVLKDDEQQSQALAGKDDVMAFLKEVIAEIKAAKEKKK